MTAKKISVLVAIDSTGKWVAYGFDELNDVGDLHQTGVTDDLEEPIAYYRMQGAVEIPGGEIVKDGGEFAHIAPVTYKSADDRLRKG